MRPRLITNDEKMDTLDELIAAGEFVVEKRKKNCLNNSYSLQCKELVSRAPVSTAIDLKCTTQDNSPSPMIKKDAFVISNDSPPISVRENLMLSTDYFKTEKEERKVLETPSNSSSNRSEESSEVESFSHLHIQKLKEECALIFSLGHSMASSLFNANRFLNQMIKNESVGCSDKEESILSEISSCDESCKENGIKLEESGSRIHYLLGKLSESYHRSKELEDTLSHVRNQVCELVELTKELLTKNNLNHLVPATQKQGLSSTRLLEEVNLGLTLLSGELPSRLLEEQNLQLHDSRNYQRRLEKRLETLEDEFGLLSEEKNKKIAEIEIQFEKTSKQLEESQEESVQLKKQKENLEERLKKQIEDIETRNTSLIHEVVRMKELLQNEKSIMAKENDKHDFIRSKLEEEINSLNQKLRSTDHQKNAQEKNAEKVCKNLEDNQSRISSENESFRAKMLKAELDKQSCVDQVKVLEGDLEKQKNLNESLLEDISDLREAAQKKAAEFAADLQLMDNKIDSKNEELCEKNSELRSMEVQLMETKMELELERQRRQTLSAEIDLLTKKTDKLQTKISKLVRFCPRDARIVCGLALTDSELESQVWKLLAESQEREAELKKLLEAKDEEMKNFQQSLSGQILQKNEELEMLSSSVECLESEMSEIVSSLNASSDLYLASHKTVSRLESRSKHIQTLQDRVKQLSKECGSCETSSAELEDLKSELSESKKNMRAAREEARKERIEAARLKQQLALLQIDLESAKEAASCLLERYPLDKSHLQHSSCNSISDIDPVNK